MADRLVVDLSPDGTASVATHLEGDDLPDSGPPFQLAWPLDDEALADLPWYLEDDLPTAVYDGRGQQVQECLAGWGADPSAGRPARGSAPRACSRGAARSSSQASKLTLTIFTSGLRRGRQITARCS